MCLITRGDSTVDVIAMGRRGDEDMQIFRHGEFVTHGSSGGLMTSQFTRERQSTAEGRIALGSKKRPPQQVVGKENVNCSRKKGQLIGLSIISTIRNKKFGNNSIRRCILHPPSFITAALLHSKNLSMGRDRLLF